MEETKNTTPAVEVAEEKAPETVTEKTFTQTEVDALIQKRLDRATKGMPSKDELAEFKAWKDSQQTEEEKWNNLTKERDTANGRVAELEKEIEQLKRQNYVLGKGATGEEAEFAIFKAAKMVSDDVTFEDAVDKIGFAAVQKTGDEIDRNISHVLFVPFVNHRPKSAESLSSFSSAPMTHNRPV